MRFMWGKDKASGVWTVSKPAWRLMWRGHDALYVAAWRVRLRVMKRQ